MISAKQMEDEGVAFFLVRTGPSSVDIEVDAPEALHAVVAANVRARMGVLRSSSAGGASEWTLKVGDLCNGCMLPRGKTTQALCGLCLCAVYKLGREALA